MLFIRLRRVGFQPPLRLKLKLLLSGPIFSTPTSEVPSVLDDIQICLDGYRMLLVRDRAGSFCVLVVQDT